MQTLSLFQTSINLIGSDAGLFERLGIINRKLICGAGVCVVKYIYINLQTNAVITM